MSSERKKRLINVLLLCAGGVLLLLGIAIHRPEKKSEFVSLFLEHLGIGFVAVTLLKIFIEDAAQRQFFNLLSTGVKEQVGTTINLLSTGVKEQVANTIISFIRRSQWILNDQVLKKELEDKILLPNFTRPNYNLTLRLEPLENHEDLLRVWITMDYQVKNISDKSGAYEVGAWLEDFIKLDNLPLESMPGFRSITIGGTPYPIEELIKEGRASGTGTILSKEAMIHLTDLKTPELEREGVVPITVVGMQIMRKADHFVWNLPTITHKLGLSITLEGGLFDELEVYPREMHHVHHEEFMNTENNPNPITRDFSIAHVVLPFQGVEIRWAPKPPKTSAPAPVPPSSTVS